MFFTIDYYFRLFAIILCGAEFSCTIDAKQGLCRSLIFTTPIEGYTLVGHVIKNLSIGMHNSCKSLCTVESKCVSINIGPPINGKMVCELSSSDHRRHSEHLKAKEGFMYRATQNPCSSAPCLHDGTCLNGFTNKGYLCECKVGYTGENCGKAVNNCVDAFPRAGIVEILNHDLDPFPVYCDQTKDEGGWTMIFKAVNGVLSPKVAHLWNSRLTLSENVSAALDLTAKHLGHYKNRIALNWTTFNPQEVRVVLYEKGNEVVSLKLNATGTNRLDWFSQANLISSPWSDLTIAANLLYFNMNGGWNRSFEISKSYGGCDADVGWLVITGGNCPWETRVAKPSIQYSKLDNAVVWENYGNVGIADVLAVFVR